MTPILMRTFALSRLMHRYLYYLIETEKNPDQRMLAGEFEIMPHRIIQADRLFFLLLSSQGGLPKWEKFTRLDSHWNSVLGGKMYGLSGSQAVNNAFKRSFKNKTLVYDCKLFFTY